MRAIDDTPHIGKRFGKWSVACANIQCGRRKAFRCVCACGVERLVDRDNLLSGKSSGCRKCSGMAGPKNPRWSGFKDIPQHFYAIAKKSAEARGISFLVSIQDVQEAWQLSRGRCALSGVGINLAGKKSGYTASLDRVDSGRGYEVGNIQFVHKDVNIMKNRFDQNYFVQMCSRIAECAAG